VKRITGQRPKRQLNDVVIELCRRVLEVMQAIDDQHGEERAGGADQRPRRGKNERKSNDDRCLCRSVVGDIGTEYAVHDLDQPPRQRRQLVGAELPFWAVSKGFDEIEGKVGVKERWQRGPNNEVECEEGAKRGLWPTFDPGNRFKYSFRRCRREQIHG